MSNLMACKISLLIAVYKRVDFLNLIFEALTKQTDQNFEIVICEDDENSEIRLCVEEWQSKFTNKIKHVFQHDNGFQKNKILNKGIRTAWGDLLIFIDGDCIPHPLFVATYRRSRKSGFVLYGRRVMLSPSLTSALVTKKNKLPISVFDLLFSGSKKIFHAFYFPWLKKEKKSGLWGCNWGVDKNELVAINGFDEDYNSAGIGEDVDVEWRLLMQGVRLLNIKNQAIVYHLNHSVHYSDSSVIININLCEIKKKLGRIYCLKGLFHSELD